MSFQFNKVTWYSIAFAIVLYVGTFALAFYLGFIMGVFKAPVVLQTQTTTASDSVINSVVFNCDANKIIQAVFFKDKVELTLSDGRNMLLPQGISASGARYANSDESFVFWNKGNTAFVQEGTETTYQNCVISPKVSQ